jgi:hypothetical protein
MAEEEQWLKAFGQGGAVTAAQKKRLHHNRAAVGGFCCQYQVKSHR